MENGFQFFDIILYALIAAFLVLRLRNVLGGRDGFEGRDEEGPSSPDADHRSSWSEQPTPEPTQDNDNVIPLPGQREPVTQDSAEDSPQAGLNAGVAQIQAADSTFNPNEFVSGAGVAFEMILGAYTQGDTRTLKNLLSTEVYENFAASIRSREEAGEILEETLVGIKSAEVVEAYMESRDAHVTVKFVSEQVNALRNASGDVIDGNPNQVITVTDFWTFARDTKSRNPNWELVATRSLD